MSPGSAHAAGWELPPGVLASGKAWAAVTRSPLETQALGRSLARQLAPPCLILLEGELGAGKTTLTKGIVEGLDAARPEEVTSPTFALVHEYGSGRVYHIDLYRIESLAELETLGLDDILGGNAVVLVEWGEKMPPALAGVALQVRLEYAGQDRRRITIAGRPPGP